MKNYRLSLLGICAVIILSYWSIAPILVPGFFPMHDDTQVARVQQMVKALTDGMFPVRWVPDLGYGFGYPLFSFYGPFSYYVGGVFMLLGLDALIATKLMMVFGIIVSGIGMYYLAKLFWGRVGGMVSALLYVYAPYHAVNLYVRGAVGELFGYACIPFVFYGIIRVYQSGKFRYALVAGVSFSALILSHNLTGLMVTPFLVLLLLFLTIFSLEKEQKMTFYFMYVSFLFGLVLSAFYWIPALLEMGYTNVISQVGGAADFREHYICLSQLWESQWGFGGSAKGCIDGLSFRLGKIHILLAGAGVLLLPFLYRKEKKRMVVIIVAFLFLLLSVFFSLEYSKSIWKVIPILSFIQYPWRFLSVISFFAAFLGGVFVWYLLDKVVFIRRRVYLQAGIAIVFFIAIIAFYGKLFIPQTIVPKTSRDFINIKTLRWDTSRISDEYLPIGFIRPQSEDAIPGTKFSVISGNAVLSGEQVKTQESIVYVEAVTQSRIQINIAYFPAWKVSVDGKETEFKVEKSGMSVVVPVGSHIIDVVFISTQIEKIADFVSLIGIFGLVTGIIFFKRKRLL